MTSSNGIIFHVTGPLCGKFTGHRWIPRTKASDSELWCFFFDLRLNKQLSKQSWDWWLRPHRAHYDVTVMAYGQYVGCWWPGDSSSWGISSHGIDLIFPEYTGFSCIRVNVEQRHTDGNGSTSWAYFYLHGYLVANHRVHLATLLLATNVLGRLLLVSKG